MERWELEKRKADRICVTRLNDKEMPGEKQTDDDVTYHIPRNPRLENCCSTLLPIGMGARKPALSSCIGIGSYERCLGLD